MKRHTQLLQPLDQIERLKTRIRQLEDAIVEACRTTPGPDCRYEDQPLAKLYVVLMRKW